MSFMFLSLSVFLSVKSFLLTSIFSTLERSLSCNQQNKHSWKIWGVFCNAAYINWWVAFTAGLLGVFYVHECCWDLSTNGKICSVDYGCKEGLDLGLQKNCTNNAPSLGLVLHVFARLARWACWKFFFGHLCLRRLYIIVSMTLKLTYMLAFVGFDFKFPLRQRSPTSVAPRTGLCPTDPPLRCRG